MKFPRLREYPYIAFDCETTGLFWWKDSIFGISVSCPDGKDYYWDIRTEPEFLEFLANEIPHCKRIICHNAKFDWHFAREAGIIFPEDRVECTLIRAALIDEHLPTYNLDFVGSKYVGVGKEDIIQELADIFGGKAEKKVQMANLHRAPARIVGKYAMQDTRTTLKLWEWQEKEIVEQDLGQVWQLEKDLLPVLLSLEYDGVRVDVSRAEAAVPDLDARARDIQLELNDVAGFDVNVNSGPMMAKLFAPYQREDGVWMLADGTPAEATPGGKASIGASTLRQMKHPAAALILQLRKIIKTRDTFIKGHILNYHHHGVIHCNFNQTRSDNDLGTGTGRLSVNAPALQQIHKRDKDIAAIVRSLFIPDFKGHDWVCNDWAQMDFRVFAHYVNDPRILEIYRQNPDADFHQMAADLTGLPRSPRFAGDANAKQINLGLVFGMGQGKLAAEMNLPYTVERNERTGKDRLVPGPEAMAVFEKYHAAIPGVKELLQSASAKASSRGYIRTAMGRRIRFPGGQAVHKAGGLIFQGSAADALKVKLIELHKFLKGTQSGARLLLNVHDEFDMTVPSGDVKTLTEVNRILTHFDGILTPIKFRVPVRTDQGIGPNWWEASK